MSYVDKICAICGIYQELIEIGRYWDKSIQDYITEYKRFEILNVCKDCMIFYRKQGFTLENAKLLKFNTSNQRLLRATCWFVQADGKTVFKRNKCYGSRVGKPHPFIYIFNSPVFEGELDSKDKRKLRRGLRKLGCRGKIEKLIK